MSKDISDKLASALRDWVKPHTRCPRGYSRTPQERKARREFLDHEPAEDKKIRLKAEEKIRRKRWMLKPGNKERMRAKIKERRQRRKDLKGVEVIEIRCSMRKGGLCCDSREGDIFWVYSAKTIMSCIKSARRDGWDVQYGGNLQFNGYGDCPCCVNSGKDWKDNRSWFRHRYGKGTDEETKRSDAESAERKRTIGGIAWSHS